MNSVDLLRKLDFKDSDDNIINTLENNNYRAYFFISINCVRCIDTASVLSELSRDTPLIDFIVFSSGDNQINKKLATYFKWDFPVISLALSDMLEKFEVSETPFLIYTNNIGRILSSGLVYGKNDVINLINIS